jgi:hypothetical protein
MEAYLIIFTLASALIGGLNHQYSAAMTTMQDCYDSIDHAAVTQPDGGGHTAVVMLCVPAGQQPAQQPGG